MQPLTTEVRVGKRKRIRVGLTLVQQQDLKLRLLGYRPDGTADCHHEPAQVCSEYWAERHFGAFTDRTERGETITIHTYDAKGYPPKADSGNCQMITCVICNVPTPISAVDRARGICLDCHCAGADVEARMELARERGWSLRLAQLRRELRERVLRQNAMSSQSVRGYGVRVEGTFVLRRPSELRLAGRRR